MTPETISALVNMGSAGAVIAVVIIFLKSIEKRDNQWRDFFTVLNTNNKDDVKELSSIMERMVHSLDAHDDQAKRIAADVAAMKSEMSVIVERTSRPTTQPRKRAQ